MVQRGSDPSLAPETMHGLLVVHKLPGREFESHEALKARVFGLIDCAHATKSDKLEDLVMADRPADEGLAGVQRALILALRDAHRSHVDCPILQKVSGFSCGYQQRPDFMLQRHIATAGFLKEDLTILAR